MADLVYKVEDRSILLPIYRRIVVDPLIRFLPAKLSPNAITHIGHLINLFGTAVLLALHPNQGWPFFVAALCLNLYTWCDNADGAHARRTKQCSPLGEFLDHGLDQFNTVYIAFLTCLGLGATPLQWVAIALLIPGGAVMTFWEQSNTGMMRLGLLNQIESVLVLSIVLLLSGVFGTAMWQHPVAFGLTGRDLLVIWPCATLLFGMARNVVRVAAQCGVKVMLPILAYLLFAACIFGAAVLDAIGAPFAVALASALNVHLGMRMLARRLKKESPNVEPLVLGGAVFAIVLVLLKLAGRPLAPDVVPFLVVIACLMLMFQVVLDARTGVSMLSRPAPGGVIAQ
ncbi:MAG: CDP-alcohol phosphatidyltransferase family protein [Polyangiaceae bacterium]|nr:CDP-alcohol phosphatidyltransferase family protein [Polyangiaceae bacterium]